MADSATIERDALAGRLFEAMLGVMDLLSIHLGDRLGCYRLLAEGGALTSAELAARAGADERYLRERLDQQAVTRRRDMATLRWCDATSLCPVSALSSGWRGRRAATSD